MEKQINTLGIITHFMEFLTENDKKPDSVASFINEFKISKKDFYANFEDFDELEQHIFNLFFENTLKALINSPEYQSFSNKDKLLSFYYTFFENLNANRDYVKTSMSLKSNDFKRLKTLSLLKVSFTNYISSLDIISFDLKQDSLENAQTKILKESSWFQLLLTMKFWLDDDSNDFEKTDILIEKSVNTSFDLIDVKALKSVIDLGKFLFKEKLNNKS